jgi:serine/threonine-protein kinase
VLGGGGMGIVYQARHVRLKRLVALKMIRGVEPHGTQEQERFRVEAEVVARLQHPNVVQIFEVGEAEGRPFLALEYVEGGSLANKLAGTPLPAREAAQLAETMACAVHAAHAQGVIHRDLKPANVLLTNDGVPKITDFGVAKLLDTDSSQTQAGQILGTPSYMAPEQARGGALAVAAPADVYALGAILYEMLTGRPPFRAASVLDTLEQVRTQEPVPPTRLQPKCPRDLETICLKCLQKEPSKRYDSCQALADDLRRFLTGVPIQARPAGWVERAWRWCRRNRRVAGLTAATFALLVAGVVGLAVGLVIIAGERNKKEQERQDADRARQNAEDARALAQKQTMLALETIRTLVREVQDQIGDNPGMQELRLKLLEVALESLEKVPENQDTWRLQGQITAGAYVKVGETYQQLGQSEKAFANIEKGRQVIQRIADREPEGDVARWNLAAVHAKLGEMSMELRRDAQAALAHYEIALDIRRELNGRELSDQLDANQVKKVLAESHLLVGVMHLKLGDPGKARGYFQDALALRQELAAAAPKDPLLKLDVARSFNALAGVEFPARQWPAARESYEKALALARTVQAGDPKNPRFKWELAITLGNYGDFAVYTGDLATAGQHYPQYVTLWQELADSDPRNAVYQRWLALAHYRAATLARKRSDPQGAARSNQACLDIREELAKADAKSERKRNDLLLVLPRCGQHTRAAELAAAIEKEAKVDREVLVLLAQCYAQCAAAVPEQAELRNRYAAKALEALNKAIASGYADLVSLETEPDLDALRGSGEFTSLLERLRKSSS